MALDPSIPLRAMEQQTRLMMPWEHQENALALQAKKMQMADLQTQAQARQQQMAQQNALASALKGARTKDGGINYFALSQAPGIGAEESMKFEQTARARQEQDIKLSQDKRSKVQQALMYADTPEKWDEMVSVLEQEIPEATQFRGKFSPQLRTTLLAQHQPEMLVPKFRNVQGSLVDANPITNPELQPNYMPQRPVPAPRAAKPSDTKPATVARPAAQPQAAQPTGAVTLTAPPKGMKLPVGFAWNPVTRRAERIPGIDSPTTKPAATQQPMPASALKQFNEARESLQLAETIGRELNLLLGAVQPPKQGGTPQLQLGPFNNLKNALRNMAGSSTPESQRFATFKSTLERLRNDSLRLNKGVQTEGDAKRAWDELFQNINDQGVVIEQLKRIVRLNNDAIKLHKGTINTIRSNYGQAQQERLSVDDLVNQYAD